MKLYTNFCYPTEIHDVVKLFFPQSELTDDPSCCDVSLRESFDGSYRYVAASGELFSERTVDVENADELQTVRLRKRYAKVAIYDLMTELCGKTMPWGSLTGIRPTKLAERLQAEGADWRKEFTDLLGVCADLYIGIPFCVSRCSYCSFTSGEIGKLGKYVQPYVDALKGEIRATLRFAKEKGIRINNVYFGGGTPTSLSAEQLDELMDCIDFSPAEYTVGAS